MSITNKQIKEIGEKTENLKNDIELNFDEIKYRCVMPPQLSNNASYRLSPPKITRQSNIDLMELLDKRRKSNLRNNTNTNTNNTNTNNTNNNNEALNETP